MAKWRRGGRRAVALDTSWWVPREQRVGDDGEAGGGQGGTGTGCGDGVAACGDMESCAAVVLEADVVPARTSIGQASRVRRQGLTDDE